MEDSPSAPLRVNPSPVSGRPGMVAACPNPKPAAPCSPLQAPSCNQVSSQQPQAPPPPPPATRRNMPGSKRSRSSSSSSSSTSSSARTAHHQPKQPASPRLFLDIFSGINAPLSAAMRALNVDCFAPFDLDKDSTCNILDDTQYRLLLRIASSGLAGVLWSAPPCKEFTRLKLRKPGPKALRTPEHMDGVSPGQQSRRAGQGRRQHRNS